mmetsp:Transcript_42495/g.122878  ORF Transcript_42495/g.122878 Transcript_42495/m.122878 type:complete len:93 (-) Transcript_42495:121-399(-)
MSIPATCEGTAEGAGDIGAERVGDEARCGGRGEVEEREQAIVAACAQAAAAKTSSGKLKAKGLVQRVPGLHARIAEGGATAATDMDGDMPVA